MDGLRMDGLSDRQVDGWMNEWIDGWMTEGGRQKGKEGKAREGWMG